MEKLKLFYAGLCGLFSYIFGGMDTLMSILLIFIVIDFISGFIKAWAKKEFNSSVFYVGGVKKIGILLIVVVATQLDLLVLGGTVILRTAAISYYIANEGFSIIENWGQLGLPLPKSIKNALIKLKGDDNDDNK
ncbi:MAG: Holin family protein [Firmicutes bacterium ADurb.Bin193]|nr:MAG: Holin family protein [Firmicutes bacterium ADurb.Bin193]